jgi:hypothetical protein
MPAYQIIPQDLLFFRDGRPMEAGAGSGGHGANWPAPSIIFDAIHAALHRAYPDQQHWEHPHRYGKSSDRDYQREATQRFGSLATAGPFPCREQHGESLWLFPGPADVAPGDSSAATTLRPMKDAGGSNNLPKPLLYPLANPSQPSKEQPKPWWSKRAVEAYLSQRAPDPGHLFESADLYAGEWTTGIGIDPTTGTQDGERIYSAEYLRLKANVSLGVVGSMLLKANNNSEGLNKLILESGTMLVLGGQQRACQVRKLDDHPLTDLLPMSQPIEGDRLKWLLLAPAIYPRIEAGEKEGRKIEAHPGGWLPSWICPQSGKVLLKMGDTRRGHGETREEWRQRVRGMGEFDCRLVAARIPKPTALTGWSERKHLLQNGGKDGHGPKPTLLAVPAGAVYYFEGKDAVELSSALSWHGNESSPSAIKNRRSTLLGEKGFGLGVCGTWSFYEKGD